MTEQTASAPKRNLTDFKRGMDNMVGISTKSYRRYSSNSDPVFKEFNLEKIRDILASGDPVALRELSRFMARYSGIYHRTLEYYAHLLLFDYVVTPKMTKSVDKTKLMARYNAALDFLDKLNVAPTMQYITSRILLQGAYYGFLRVFNGGVTIQELPIEYCRSRFKSPNGVYLLEFNVRYFETLGENPGVLDAFPAEVRLYYQRYKEKTNEKIDPWMPVPATLGVAFYFEDFIPLFARSIPEFYRLEQAQDREADRDKEELEKLLINEMPISNKTDEPIFTMDETEVMHAGMVQMLQNNDHIDVLTTYGDAELVQAQDLSGQSQRNSLEKFTTTLYDNLGVSGQLFNAEGNTALRYSVDKDTSLMFNFAMQYATWLTFIVNERYSAPALNFDVEFLPTTIHNRKELMDTYLKGAQYGYSKIYVGVAQGIKQSNLINLVNFENDILDLSNKMLPLQSSHTLSNSQNSDGNSGNTTNSGDNNNEPGRPELPDANKSDKTIANRDAM